MTARQLQKQLLDRFNSAALFYLEGLEFGDLQPWQDAAIEMFEEMSQSVPAIPESTLAKTIWHAERIGPRSFNRHLDDAIASVGRVSHPKNATEFLDLLNLGFEHVGP